MLIWMFYGFLPTVWGLTSEWCCYIQRGYAIHRWLASHSSQKSHVNFWLLVWLGNKHSLVIYGPTLLHGAEFLVSSSLDLWCGKVNAFPRCEGQACTTDGTVYTTSSNNRLVRIVKILRILRVARVLKLIKFVTWDTYRYVAWTVYFRRNIFVIPTFDDRSSSTRRHWC